MKVANKITVYTTKTSPRLRYVFKYVLIDVIGFSDVLFETNLENFKLGNGVKLNYSNTKIENVIWVVPHSLLFETGLKDQEIKVFSWENTKAFFATNRNATMPFDLFAATFYLISRYEEYLPSIHDKHERYEAHESISYKENFLTQAVVNRWANYLRALLLEQFLSIYLHTNKYNFLNSIDIDNAWAYKNKGLFRTIGAFIKDVVKADWSNIAERFKVLFGNKQDMYDTYKYLFNLQEEHKLKSIYFFLFADYGVNDKNVSIENKRFRQLIKAVADEAEVGIHPSYNSNKHAEKLESEIKNLSKVIKRDVTKSRQHFLKLSFPQTYQTLIERDIADDYTMGYASEIGFRAGTCTPFYFYNIDLEIETKLRIHPFQVMDATLLYYMKLTPEKSIEKITEIIEEVKFVGGTFVSLWHNETLSNTRQWLGWRSVYHAMVAKAC